jgi:hypothetical protein
MMLFAGRQLKGDRSNPERKETGVVYLLLYGNPSKQITYEDQRPNSFDLIYPATPTYLFLTRHYS